MKILTAFVTALTLIGFGSAAFACEGMYKRTKTDTARAEEPLLPPTDKTS